ncbi:MAG: discoidin domain-containing protein [Pseudomonadota bacterium]
MRATLVVLGALLPGLVGAQSLEQAAAERGQEVLRTLTIDLDLDRRPEILAAVLVEHGVALTVWRQLEGKPLVQLFSSPVYDGEVVLRLQARQLVADANPEVIFEVREVNPDETTRRLVISRWLKGALVPIYDSLFSVDDIRPARPGEELLAFGDTAAGYRFVDSDGDGNLELAVRRDVKVFMAQRPDKSALRVIAGAQETLFRFQPQLGRAGEYVAGKEQFHPYVDELKPSKTGGSSQLLPAHLESKYGRQAVERGVKDVFADLGAKAGDTGKAASKPAEEGSPDSAGDEQLAMQRDPAPHASWAADGDLGTCWCEGADGDGQGQWWEADYGQEQSLRMARLVFGDVSSNKTYVDSNRITGVTLLFSSGDKLWFDRGDPAFSGGPIAGFKDVPLGDGRPGAQTLVFFTKPLKATWVRVEFSAVKVRGKQNRSCLSEAVFYGTSTGGTTP